MTAQNPSNVGVGHICLGKHKTCRGIRSYYDILISLRPSSGFPLHHASHCHSQFITTTSRCPILESIKLILIEKIGKSVFWTYVRRIVPLVIRRIISPSVYHGKIIFSREIRLSNVTLLLTHNCVCKRK
jgi:hypothetical protein